MQHVSNLPERDRVPVWHLCANADMPKRELIPLLARLNMPLYVSDSGDMYTSRTAFRELLVEVAE